MIWTAGYAGHTPDELLQAARQHKALVIDISPTENAKLCKLMPGKYMHCPALGNKNYKGGPIELYDPARGMDFIEHMSKIRNLILLCVCRDSATCHRTVIAEMLELSGLSAQEMEWPLKEQS